MSLNYNLFSTSTVGFSSKSILLSLIIALYAIGIKAFAFDTTGDKCGSGFEDADRNDTYVSIDNSPPTWQNSNGMYLCDQGGSQGLVSTLNCGYTSYTAYGDMWNLDYGTDVILGDYSYNGSRGQGTITEGACGGGSGTTTSTSTPMTGQAQNCYYSYLKF